MTHIWIAPGRGSERGPVFFCTENPAAPNGGERVARSSARSAQRIAVLVGFPPALERAIVGVVKPYGLDITTVSTPDQVPVQPPSVPQLVVVSGRCGPLSVLELIERLGKPRSTRVVVLLHGPNAEIERAYRAAGIRMVLTMPVGLHALLSAGNLVQE